MPNKEQRRSGLLDSWFGSGPGAKAGGGTPRASGGGDSEPGAEGGEDYVSQEQLDNAIAGVTDSMKAGFDEIKSMLTDDDDPSAEGGKGGKDVEDPAAMGGDDDDDPVAATEDTIKARIPTAPVAFVESCVAAGMTIDQVVKQYDVASQHESVTAMGSHRPRSAGRGAGRGAGGGGALKGTADGFRAMVRRRTTEILAKGGVDEITAEGQAINALAPTDADGYAAYQADETQRHWKAQHGLAS
ncbi:MAG: hypothetical protein AAFR96_09305 [Planctomycetota bacterium]